MKWMLQGMLPTDPIDAEVSEYPIGAARHRDARLGQNVRRRRVGPHMQGALYHGAHNQEDGFLSIAVRLAA